MRCDHELDFADADVDGSGRAVVTGECRKCRAGLQATVPMYEFRVTRNRDNTECAYCIDDGNKTNLKLFTATGVCGDFVWYECEDEHLGAIAGDTTKDAAMATWIERNKKAIKALSQTKRAA